MRSSKNQNSCPNSFANQIQTSSINNNRSNLCILFKHQVNTNAGKEEIGLSLLSFDNKTEATLASTDVSVSVNHWNLPHDEKPSNLSMIGHCNGIICLANCKDENNVILVNPTIRELRFLQSSCIPTPPPPLCYKVVMLRFGYDLKTDDYKVVRTVTILPDEFIYEVYTSSTDSWREINNAVIKPYIYWAPGFEIYFNGVFYWRSVDLNSDPRKDVILAFDFSDEVFQTI